MPPVICKVSTRNLVDEGPMLIAARKLRTSETPTPEHVLGGRRVRSHDRLDSYEYCVY